MEITYEWVIKNIACHAHKDGQSDVVMVVAWQLNGTDGEHSDFVFGAVELEYVSGQDYTPYENLTKEQVINWVKYSLGDNKIMEYEGLIYRKIEDAKTPQVVIKKLPWE
jgi:hypothetical protein